ncbi:MAG: hypothetical protein AAB855_04630, partial [Patescibacteria group bacterium]
RMKKKEEEKRFEKAWVVTVDMGYGHQRAAYPLHDIAYKGIITMNNYKGLPRAEKDIWHKSREGYEFVSRLQARSVIGKYAFELFDKIQEIPRFYPRRDLSKPNLQLLQTYNWIEKHGLGKHLFTKVLSENQRLPLMCTFFLPAFAAEFYGYEGEIYCQICDADVSRTWVPKDPKRSRIKYLAPNKRVVERLKLYGVQEENIFYTGFPLPKENIGGTDFKVLKKDLGARLLNLDPNRLTLHKFGHIINYHLGKKYIPERSNHPLTLVFAVGGAGAQSDIGEAIVKSLRKRILGGELRLHLIAGVRKEVKEFFEEQIKVNRLEEEVGRGIHVFYEKTKQEYFRKFNALLRKSDILWTKPSELSFYTALGLPIIMAPSVGSQEDFNRIWLKTVGGGISQDDPRYADEWLFDWIESGWLARAALNGFIEAPLLGTYATEKLVLTPHNHEAERIEEKAPLAV